VRGGYFWYLRCVLSIASACGVEPVCVVSGVRAKCKRVQRGGWADVCGVCGVLGEAVDWLCVVSAARVGWVPAGQVGGVRVVSADLRCERCAWCNINLVFIAIHTPAPPGTATTPPRLWAVLRLFAASV